MFLFTLSFKHVKMSGLYLEYQNYLIIIFEFYFNVTALVKRQYTFVKRIDNEHRNIQILKFPDSYKGMHPI